MVYRNTYSIQLRTLDERQEVTKMFGKRWKVSIVFRLKCVYSKSVVKFVMAVSGEEELELSFETSTSYRESTGTES